MGRSLADARLIVVAGQTLSAPILEKGTILSTISHCKCGHRYQSHLLKGIRFFECPKCGVFDPLGRFSGTMADARKYIGRDRVDSPQMSMFEGEK